MDLQIKSNIVTDFKRISNRRVVMLFTLCSSIQNWKIRCHFLHIFYTLDLQTYLAGLDSYDVLKYRC
jgi:hypothetical protein